MKQLLTIALFFVCSLSFAQAVKEAPVKQDSIKLTKIQEEKLMGLEAQINELKRKQVELMELILDANGVDLTKVTDFKYERGKFIFKTKLK